MNKKTTVIGLTGGTGSGKTTMSKYLANNLGYKVIDADDIGRALLKDDKKTIDEVVKCFGIDILDENGNIKRDKLSKKAFGDEGKLHELENIVTTRICEEIKEQVNHQKIMSTNPPKASQNVIIIDAPLLFEKKLDILCDTTCLVTCDVNERIKRIKIRDKLTEEEILQRINNQIPDEEKKKLVSTVITNDGTLEELYSKARDYIERF